MYHKSKIVRILEREDRIEKRTRHLYKFLKIIRVLSYGILSLLVLSSTIISKGSLLNITSQLGHIQLVNDKKFINTFKLLITNKIFFNIQLNQNIGLITLSFRLANILFLNMQNK